MRDGKRAKPFTRFQKLVIVVLFALTVGGAFAIFRVSGGTLANLTLSTQPSLEQGLLLHWTFDGNDFDTAQAAAEVRDRSGQGRQGDYVNGVGGGGGVVPESTTTTELTDASFVFNMPATRPDGDLYILFATTDDPNAFTAPAGWNTAETDPTTFYAWVAWRIGSSEPATYTLEGNPDAGLATVMRLSGADATSPINQSDFDVDSSGTSITAPAVTPTVDDTLIVRLYLSDGGVISAVPATTWFDENNSDSLGHAGSYEAGPASGQSSGTASATQASDNWGAATLAIAPALGLSTGGGSPAGAGAVGQALTFDGVDDHASGALPHMR
jgi:hypothetical protein